MTSYLVFFFFARARSRSLLRSSQLITTTRTYHLAFADGLRTLLGFLKIFFPLGWLLSKGKTRGNVGRFVDFDGRSLGHVIQCLCTV